MILKANPSNKEGVFYAMYKKFMQEQLKQDTLNK